jgi:hypothetical protein
MNFCELDIGSSHPLFQTPGVVTAPGSAFFDAPDQMSIFDTTGRHVLQNRQEIGPNQPMRPQQ